MMIRCMMPYRSEDRFKWAMTVRGASHAKARARMGRISVSTARLSMGWNQSAARFGLTLRSPVPGVGMSEWSLPIKQTVDPSLMSSAGQLLPGSSLDSLPNGETQCTLVLRNAPVTGEKISVWTADDVVLFSGSIARSTYDASADTWTVVASDPLSAKSLDDEISVDTAREITEVLPFEIVDMTLPSEYQTIPGLERITMRYWVQMLEILKDARLFYDPFEGVYVLSNLPRVWKIQRLLSFSEEIDAMQYFNVVVVEQDDTWEEPATREKRTKEYKGFTLKTDAEGEKVHSMYLSKGNEVVVDESFEYDERHQLVRSQSKKDAKTTTKQYTIYNGEVPYITRELMLTIDSEGEAAFDERVDKRTEVVTSDEGDIVVRVVESREYWEAETRWVVD